MDKRSTQARCGAQLRKKPGRYCRVRAGFKTPHLGEGRCNLHGGLTPIKSGRYSRISHARLKDILLDLELSDQQTLDLEPEARLLRAMVIDYVNRYDSFVEELHAWAVADQRSRGKGAPPPKLDLLSLHDAAGLVESVSRVVEKIHKITRESALTLDTFRRVMEQMGLVVAKHVDDPNVLKQIEADWSSVIVDARSFSRQDTAPHAEDAS